MTVTYTNTDPINVPSKRERFLKRAKIKGTHISAKNISPSPNWLGYKGQQWSSGSSGSGPNGGRRKSGLSRRGRFVACTGPTKFKSKSA